MIKLENVTFRYNKKHKALINVNAEFGPGMHLLLGPNGAGKTTLFGIIAGLLVPQQGVCFYDKEATYYHTPHTVKDIFFLKDDMVFPLKTINEMAVLHGDFYPNFSEEFLAKALAAFGLTGEEKLSEMSLGTRKKAQLAYALALGTTVLLLDEPANGLDMTSKKTLTQLLSMALDADPKKCIIVATHTVQEMRNLFESVTLLNNGQIVFNASIAKIVERLAFIKDSAPHDDALYYEAAIEGPTQIVPNDGELETAVDFSLLFSAAIGENSDKLKSLLS